jgi:hypothetical protein
VSATEIDGCRPRAKWSRRTWRWRISSQIPAKTRRRRVANLTQADLKNRTVFQAQKAEVLLKKALTVASIAAREESVMRRLGAIPFLLMLIACEAPRQRFADLTC